MRLANRFMSFLRSLALAWTSKNVWYRGRFQDLCCLLQVVAVTTVRVDQHQQPSFIAGSCLPAFSDLGVPDVVKNAFKVFSAQRDSQDSFLRRRVCEGKGEGGGSPVGPSDRQTTQTNEPTAPPKKKAKKKN